MVGDRLAGLERVANIDHREAIDVLAQIASNGAAAVLHTSSECVHSCVAVWACAPQV